jgi:uroporphyrinogen decarboxylase
MNARQRVENCINGGPVDRTPVALWRHFPVDDQSPESLAAATINFQRTFEFDFVKVTPASSYCLKDWGIEDEWRGATEGTRNYVNHVIRTPDDWMELSILDPHSGALGDQLTCLRLLVKELGPNIPIIQTIFNPLSQAKNLVGKDELIVHLRLYPDAVHEGLKKIAESTQRFIEAAKDIGITGVFFAVQHASYSILTIEEYDTFGCFYDLQLLESARDMWLNVLHIHGNDIMFDRFVDYPVSVINWHDREAFPSLKKAQSLFSGVLCGGLQREKTMVLGTPEQVIAETKDAILATSGQRFILGTGCVVPITAPFGNIKAARSSVYSD